MKKTALVLLVLAIPLLTTAQKPGAIIDVTQYQFTVTLNDTDNVIQGKAAIELRILSNTPTVTFDLVNKKGEKGMTVQQVTEGDKPVTYIHANNILTIHLTSPAKANEKKTFIITYGGIPADGLIIANNKYKHRGFFADNWPNRARNWLPCVDHPADKAAADFIVIAPDHYQVVSNGIQVEESALDNHQKLTHYTETVPLATKVMVIGVADFAVQRSGDVQCIPVYSWVYPEDREKGFYDYALATEILPFYIKNIGPYGYRKLANVQSKTMFGGLENASAIFYAENSVKGTRASETLLAHEIAHQWFGNMATESDWKHLWLSEGFATYMTILYMENKYGADTARAMLKEDRDQVIAFAEKTARPVVDSTVTNYMQLLNANSYQKGSWVLHMLRRHLGDSTFWKSIRTYYARYAGKNASTDDLRTVFQEVSGKDLTVFFRQWLFTGGLPELNMTWKYNDKQKAVVLTVNQQQAVPFQFPLELAIETATGITTKPVTITNKQTVVTIPVAQKPRALIADPNTCLLFAGTLTETK
jgi:aminopeptidase N